MIKKTCANCLYFRQGHWCSNSKSEHFRFAARDEQFVQESDACTAFTRRGKKAGLLTRMKIKALKLLRRRP